MKYHLKKLYICLLSIFLLSSCGGGKGSTGDANTPFNQCIKAYEETLSCLDKASLSTSQETFTSNFTLCIEQTQQKINTKFQTSKFTPTDAQTLQNIRGTALEKVQQCHSGNVPIANLPPEEWKKLQHCIIKETKNSMLQTRKITCKYFDPSLGSN